jgi:hypothetical protein
MTSPKGMMSSFRARTWKTFLIGKKKLQMDVEVKELDENKLFKIAKLNLKGKARD